MPAPTFLLVATIAWLAMREAAAAPAIVDIFAVRTWEPPPPPVVAPPPAPPVPPEPPPLPFVFLGRIVEAGKGAAYLLNERGAVRIVRVGDRLAGGYLVEDDKAGRLVFVYLPMKIRQTLPIGDRP